MPEDRGALGAEIRDAAQRLKVKDKLEAFRRALCVIEEHEGLHGIKYFLLVLRPERKSLSIQAYGDGGLVRATGEYLIKEKLLANTAGETVLVASDSLESLRRAYPNYFLDTRRFIEEMDQLLA